jgi:D-xylono/L-arabinono-1,4-lactonase
MRVIEPVANYHCVTGENPLWRAAEGRIYWEDIETGRLFRAEHVRAQHDAAQHECFYRGDKLGGFTFQADGSLLLFEADRIARLTPDGERRVLKSGFDPAMERFNDVIADPEGRVFAGTIGTSDQNGGLFCVERDGSARLLWRGTGCANGMAFTPDGRGLYWTCSTTRRIYLSDYDRATGALTDRRLFYAAPGPEGIPDGLSVDEQGHVWTTRWDGHAIYRLSPQAEVVERIELPVAKVSSIAFGGPDLDVAYVTTAGGTGTAAGGAEGTLYRITGLGVRGQAEHLSRVMV